MACSTLQLKPVPGSTSNDRAAAAVYRDVERGAPPTNGDGAQRALGEIEAQRAQAGRRSKAEGHGNQRLLTQYPPDEYHPSGHPLPII